MGIQSDLPLGDPGGMRQAAAAIEVQREELERLDRRLGWALANLVYRCPAGEELRDQAAAKRRAVAVRIVDLERLCLQLEREAGALVETQAALDLAARQALRW